MRSFELSCDRLTIDDFTDIETTVRPRMQAATAAAIDRIANRVSRRRTYIFGPDKKGK